ncbi:MAG: hypothetical protein RIQ81_2321 [Pseudomonadota bacterium]
MKKVYFVGIGGTGMASVAGLMQSAGYQISGSDVGIYPPMSTMLEELKIPVFSPYNEENIRRAAPDLVVIANALSRGNVELEYVLSAGIPYTSFPAICGDTFIKDRVGVVVTGTHGKTTTTSLLAHILTELGEDPGFVVGGIPRNFPRSFHLGRGKTFIIEGDEYDTAFFDKGPKFLHYYPNHLILNNLEYDHADIYPNVEAIEAQFAKLCGIVPANGVIFANVDDPGIARLLGKVSPAAKVVKVSTSGQTPGAEVSVRGITARADGPEEQIWTARIQTRTLGEIAIETHLSGKHNIANIAQVIACIESLAKLGHLKNPLTAERIQAALASFKNVKRRLDHLASGKGIDVYEDFAHHPTAVGLVIEGFRTAYPGRRLLVAFDPRNATSRRNVFQDAFAQKLGMADRVFIGPCPEDKRIPVDQRMDTRAMASSIGEKARAYDSHEALLDALKGTLHKGDAVIFMSSGSFNGIQHELARQVKEGNA